VDSATRSNIIWFGCKKAAPSSMASQGGKNYISAAYMLYLAKLVFLSNRIMTIFQIQADKVINNLHLFEIFQNNFTGGFLLIYFSGLHERKFFLSILDSFVVIDTLLTIFSVQQIVQNRPFFRIF
jgi:hypothetical protein